MGVLLKVLSTSIMSVAQMLLLTFVGVLAALYPKDCPLLAPGSVRVIARLTQEIFMPFWTLYAIGSQINLQAVIDDWPLLIAGFATVILGFLVADITKPLFNPDETLVPAMRVCVAQCNALAVPLVLMYALCEGKDQNEDFGRDASKCFDKTSADVGIFMVAWQIMLWTYTYATLENSRPKEELAEEELAVVTPVNKYKRYLRLLLLQPNMLALLLGILIGLTPLRGMLFRSANPTPVRPIGAAIGPVGSPFVCMLILVMAAALVHGYLQRANSRREKRAARRMFHLTRSFSSGSFSSFRRRHDSEDPECGDLGLDNLSTSASVVDSTSPRSSFRNLFISSHPSFRSFVSRSGEEGDGIVSVVVTTPKSKDKEEEFKDFKEDSVAEPNKMINENDDDVEEEENPQSRFVATALWFISAKLIFVPAIVYILLTVLNKYNFGLSKHSRLIILIEFATPSAQTILTILYALDLGDIAQKLAPYYFLQYIVSIITMTAFVTWAIFTL